MMVRINPEHYEHDHEEQRKNEESGEQAALHLQCEAELESCRQELAQMKDRLQRISADFENFKKRIERDRLLWTDTLEAELIRELLPVVDDFDRALVEQRKASQSPESLSYITGFELIAKGLYKFLTAHNVREITNLTTFDPQFHEAVMSVTSPDHKTGDIVAVLQKGFQYKDVVLRPAKVTVAA
jgi:molecular chaperone GrpE